MKKIAVFPGSFDPITIGHQALVKRAHLLFDEIIVAIGKNSNKKHMFSLNERMEWINQAFKSYSNVSVASYEGLTVNFCKSVNAKYILRGLRTAADFEFERAISQVNQVLEDDVQSIFLITQPSLSAISSSIVRDIITNNGDASKFIPSEITIS